MSRRKTCAKRYLTTLAARLSVALLVPACGGGSHNNEGATSANAPAVPALSVNVPGQDFGSVAVGSTSSAATLTITNRGTAAAAGLVTTFSSPGSVFAATTDNCSGSSLAAGKSCTIGVTFSPLVAGNATGTLTVATSDGSVWVTAGLTGIGVGGTGVAGATLLVAPSQHDFGSVGVGQPQSFGFTVTNTGSGTSGVPSVSIASGDFNQFSESDNCSAALAGGATPGTCTVTVTFNPPSSGTKNATLAVAASPGGTVNIALVGEGVAPAVLAFQGSASLTFPDTAVGSTSSASTFTVVNNGAVATSSLAVATSGTNAAEFTITADTCSGDSVSAGATCQITVAFAPMSVGDNEVASIDVSATTGGSISGALAGNALVPAALGTTPSTIDFGGVIAGQSSNAETILVANTGELATQTLAAASLADSTNFAIVSDSCRGQSLAPGGDCQLQAQFTAPATAGSVQSTLTLGDGVTTVPVAGTALPAEALVFSPSFVVFAPTQVGSTAQATLTLTNNSATTAVTNLTFTAPAGDFSIDTSACGTSLAAGSSCQVTATYTPTAAGPANVTFKAQSNDPSLADGILTLAGFGLGAPLAAAPASFDFGGVLAGQASDSEAITFTNNGQASTLTVLPAALDSSFDFTIVSDGCGGKTLAPTASCQVGVEFTPNAGTRNSTVASLNVSDGAASAATVSLTGFASGPGSVVFSPSFVVFPDTPLGDASAAQTLTVTNTSSINVPTQFQVSGPDFVVDSSACGTRLTPGESCQLGVAFAPSAFGGVGSKQETLSEGVAALTALSGKALPAVLSVDPPEFFFGGVAAGTTSNTGTLTFTNEETTGIILGTATLADPTDFQVPAATDNCSGQTLAAGASCTLGVQFTPSASASTNQELKSRLSVGDGASANASVPLDGLVGGGIAGLVFSPSFANAGHALVNSTTTVSFQVTNNTPTAIGVRQTGSQFLAGGPSFSVNTSAFANGLSPGRTASVTVTFQPTSAPQFDAARLYIIATGGPVGTMCVDVMGTADP